MHYVYIMTIMVIACFLRVKILSKIYCKCLSELDGALFLSVTPLPGDFVNGSINVFYKSKVAEW